MPSYVTQFMSEDLLSISCHLHHRDVLVRVRGLIVVVDRDVQRVLDYVYGRCIVASVTL